MKKEFIVDRWKVEMSLWEEMPRDTKYVKQTHGKDIVDASVIRNGITEADGIVTLAGKGPVAIRTADCLPLVITTSEKAMVIHISRKTLIQGILDGVTEHLKPADITGVFMGPHICEKDFAFEYEGNQITEFKTKFPAAVYENKKIHLSIRKAVQNYLEQWGIDNSKIIEDARCTYEDDQLPSYRRSLDTDTSLQHIATIVSSQGFHE